MRDVVEEGNGEFVLPLKGFVCLGWERDWLVLGDPDRDEEARLSGLTLTGDVAEPLVARQASVLRAVADKRSNLRVDFDGDVTVAIPPSADFEAWEVRGPGSVLVIAPAGGGGPAVWDATSKTYRLQGGELVELEEGESR